MTMRVLSNIWYGELVDADLVEPPRRTYRAQLAAGWRLLRRSRGYDLVVTSEGRLGPPGMVVLCLGLAFMRKRKLAVMEFLPGHKHGILGSAVAFTYRRLLHRVCLLVQVMTDEEFDTYTADYRIPPALLRHIPYYHLDDRILAAHAVPRSGVFSSGQQSCDWDTLLDAADGQRWDLTIICTARDYALIHSRAVAVGARIESDIPRQRHDELLATAAVCVVSLTNDHVSSGHTRLMSALSLQTPTILSDVPGVQGYTVLASELVEPGNPEALRAAVNATIADPHRLDRSMARARESAEQWTFSKYSEAIRQQLERVLE